MKNFEREHKETRERQSCCTHKQNSFSPHCSEILDLKTSNNISECSVLGNGNKLHHHMEGKALKSPQTSVVVKKPRTLFE